jgi:hypothetical protein
MDPKVTPDCKVLQCLDMCVEPAGLQLNSRNRTQVKGLRPDSPARQGCRKVIVSGYSFSSK